VTISVRIIAPDLVEVTETPSWWERLLGGDSRVFMARIDGGLCGSESCWCRGGMILDAISQAFADDAARRRAETTRNYQAAAQRGEYPLR
jgi:hypothetical protein